MKFIGAYDNLTLSENSVITDGQFTCNYAQLPDFFANIANIFKANNINNEDSLVLEFDNSLASAIVLLFLLEKGYSFLLTKYEKTLQNDNTTKFIPKFCSYLISIESNSINPSEFLHIHKNHNAIIAARFREKLYVRTSGSTGSPKLIVYHHNNLLGNILCCSERLKLNSNNRVAFPVPVSHLFGLGAGFLPSISVQASIDLQKGANIVRYLQREREFNPDTVFMTPVFCEILVKGRRQNRAYQLTVIAGDRMKTEVFTQYEERFGCLVQLYGSTEMGALASGNREDNSNMRSRVIGKPMPDVELRLNTELKCGELWCRRKYGFSGWLDENGNSIDLGLINKEGWYNTRDLGIIHEDGCVEVLGRADHSVNRDGLLVLFADVEKALEKIGGIISAIVITKGESQRGKGLLAYCVIEKNANLDEQTIRLACFDLLPKRSIPDKIIIVDTLPVLPSGKVDRLAIVKFAEKEG